MIRSRRERYGGDQRMPAPIRFWNRVNKTDGCWLWIGSARGSQGLLYGELRVNGRTTAAHRFAYESFVGPIPAGLTIDHLCRETLCVNPKHLEAVSMKVNILRGTSPTAKNAAKTLCKRGHAAFQRIKNRRQCIICRQGYERLRGKRDRRKP